MSNKKEEEVEKSDEQEPDAQELDTQESDAQEPDGVEKQSANDPSLLDSGDSSRDISDIPYTINAGPVAGSAVDSAASDIASLQEQLATAKRQADENWDKFIRLQAELDNVVKRGKRDLEQAHKFALEKFINELIPVRDSLEEGLNYADQVNLDAQKIKEGNEAILRLLAQAMEKFNVVQIDPQDEPFDPNRHEAVGLSKADGVKPNHILRVVQKGYLLNQRLIRPARVVVAQESGNQEQGSEDNEDQDGN